MRTRNWRRRKNFREDTKLDKKVICIYKGKKVLHPTPEREIYQLEPKEMEGVGFITTTPDT